MSREYVEFVGHVSMGGGHGEFKLGTFELSVWNEAPFNSKYKMHVVIRAEDPSVRMAITKWPRNWTAILPRNTAVAWAILNGDGFEAMLDAEHLRATGKARERR